MALLVTDSEDIQGQNPKDNKILQYNYLRNEVTGKIAPQWFEVGLQLGVSVDELDLIKQLTNPCGGKCTDMLRIWFKRDMGDPVEKLRPTWQNIYDAMCALDMNRAAEDLKDELIPPATAGAEEIDDYDYDDNDDEDFDMN